MRTRSTAATTINQRAPMKRFFQQAVVILLVYAQVLPALAQVTTINTGNMTLTPTAPAAPVTTAPLIVSNSNTSVAWGQITKLTTTCGGFNADGSLQQECTPQPAIFKGESVGLCPNGTFGSPGTKTCWSCPPGYKRSIYPIRGPRACSKPDLTVKAERSAATFLSKKFCPAGSFWDPLDDGMCWTCPEGYIRSAATVTAPDACVQGIGSNRLETYAEAIQEFGCQPGEIFDPRNGGECWSCPKGQLRQIGNPITAPDACGAPAGIAFAPASDEGPRMCGPGQIFDPATSRNGHVAERIRKQYNNQVPPQVLATLGSTRGTCWTCPPASKRTGNAVWTDKACTGPALGMVPGRYDQPGLFRLDGGEEVALAVAKQRTGIERIAGELAGSLGQTPANLLSATWQEIKASPQASLVLMLAVYERLLLAIEKPQEATAAEKRLVAAFAESYRRYQTYMAQTALDALDTYEKAQRMYVGQTSGSAVQVSMSLYRRPDFDGLSTEFIISSMGASVALGAGHYAVLAVKPLRSKILPFRAGRTGGGGRIINEAGFTWVQENAEKVLNKIMKESAEKVAEVIAKGAGMAANSTLMALGAAGPQIIITAMAELIQLGIESSIAAAYNRPKLLANLSLAQAPVDLARMLATDQGEANIDKHWSMASVSTVPPIRIADFATAADQGVAAMAAAAAAAAPRFSIQAKNSLCLNPGANGSVLVSACGATTRWVYITGNGLQLSGTAQCLTSGADNSSVSLTNCQSPTPASQSWQNTNQGWITSTASQRCLETGANGTVSLKPCNARTPLQAEQLWTVVR